MNNETEAAKSIVTSYRLKEDTKDKIKQQLDQLGLTQEQYFNRVVSLMELENVKQSSFLSKDTTIIQSNLDSILNAFISIADSSNNLIGNKDTELEAAKHKYKDMLFNKENNITELKLELQQVYDNIRVLQNENDNNKNEVLSTKIEYNKQLDQMESNLKDKTSLIAEYKVKNDDLLSIVSEYKQYKVDAEEYKKLLSDAQTKNIELNNSLKDKDLTINNLNKNIEKLKADNISEIETLKDKASIKLEKSLLESQKKHQQDLEKLNNKHNADIVEYQEKYKALLEKMENDRNKNIETTPKVKTK